MAIGLIAAFLLAYLVGSIPTSIIVCRLLKGIDIRKFGSGNAGATNVYRVAGLKIAVFVLAIDALKGVFGVSIPHFLFPQAGLGLKILGGFFAIVGHIWTVFAGFKGGKGIGPSLGVFLALTPLPALIAFVIWLVSMVLTRIVSISSMLAGAALAVSTFLFYKNGIAGTEKPLVYFTAGIALLIVVTHRKNIQRLINGTEARISSQKKDGHVQ
jgi:glycerol-3-phosphate acyltransferase PlsY